MLNNCVMQCYTVQCCTVHADQCYTALYSTMLYRNVMQYILYNTLVVFVLGEVKK